MGKPSCCAMAALLFVLAGATVLAMPNSHDSSPSIYRRASAKVCSGDTDACTTCSACCKSYLQDDASACLECQQQECQGATGLLSIFDCTGDSHDKSRCALALTALVMIPFMLRSVGDLILGKIKEYCCKCCFGEVTPDGYAPMGSGEGATIQEVSVGHLTWGKAVQKSRLTPCGAVVVAMLRLVGWHLMQPMLYWWALWSYWEVIDGLQLVFGVIVGVREIMYVLLCFIGLCVRPTYLLADVLSSYMIGGWVEIAIYVLTPEKYVILCISRPIFDQYFMGGSDSSAKLCIVPSMFMDMAAVGAIIAACVSGITPPALMIGYSVTALAGVTAKNLLEGGVLPTSFCN